VHQQAGVGGERHEARREPLQQRGVLSNEARSVLPISSSRRLARSTRSASRLRAQSSRRRSVTADPAPAVLVLVGGPIPRPVVPSFWLFSLAASSSL
jgi:hypothetical protein